MDLNCLIKITILSLILQIVFHYIDTKNHMQIKLNFFKKKFFKTFIFYIFK